MVDVISQFLTSGSKLTDAIELFGTDFELANISIATILVTLLTAAVCGAVIYLVYRFFNRSVIYNENFNILVILTTIVTSFIIMTISSNVVLSLGMVGALSIVRFRVLGAVKYRLKNKTQTGNKIELTVEVKIRRNDTTYLSRFNAIDGVESVTLLEYSGEYMN